MNGAREREGKDEWMHGWRQNTERIVGKNVKERVTTNELKVDSTNEFIKNELKKKWRNRFLTCKKLLLL